jgi:hypothetical protein
MRAGFGRISHNFAVAHLDKPHDAGVFFRRQMKVGGFARFCQKLIGRGHRLMR